MKNEKRKTENGKRKTENGKRKTENGKRKTENGKKVKQKRVKVKGKIEFPRRNAFLMRRVVSSSECRMSKKALPRKGQTINHHSSFSI